MRRSLVAFSLFAGCLAMASTGFAQEIAAPTGTHPVGFSVNSNSETILALSPTLADAGQPITLRADVQPTQGGPVPTGYVGFYYGGYLLGNAPLKGNTAMLSLDTKHIPDATYSVVAKYYGDSYYQPSTSQTVFFSIVLFSNCNVSLSSSPSSVAPGNPITLRAPVQPISGGPAATGTVLFFAGANNQYYLGSAPVKSTVAQFTVSTRGVPEGSYPFQAVYTGDSFYNACYSNPSWVFVQ